VVAEAGALDDVGCIVDGGALEDVGSDAGTLVVSPGAGSVPGSVPGSVMAASGSACPARSEVSGRAVASARAALGKLAPRARHTIAAIRIPRS
jgi:hypothetical protein